jgi:regulator of replication initiation timing
MADGDQHYQIAKKRLAELLDTNSRLSIELEQLRNEFAARKAVTFGLAERLHYQTVCKAAANRNSKVEIALCQTN